jgi:hypothetical protein
LRARRSPRHARTGHSPAVTSRCPRDCLRLLPVAWLGSTAIGATGVRLFLLQCSTADSRRSCCAARTQQIRASERVQAELNCAFCFSYVLFVRFLPQMVELCTCLNESTQKERARRLAFRLNGVLTYVFVSYAAAKDQRLPRQQQFCGAAAAVAPCSPLKAACSSTGANKHRP